MNRFALTSLVGLLPISVAYAQTVLRLTQLPAQTPAAATIYLAGSCNAWQPADKRYAFTRTARGDYQCSLPASLTGTIEFKLTRGSWVTVETDARQQDIANRRLQLEKRPSVVELQVAGWKDNGPGSAPVRCQSTALRPNVQILDSAFQMPQLSRKRRIWVYLPNDYTTAPSNRYPVLYMHDGQNVFDACTSFSGEWGVDEALSQLQQQRLYGTDCIVVAIDHGDSERLNELSPWKNSEYGGGQGDRYVDFLVQTLKPYIDAHYRTLSGREFTGLAGSSMGGLISTYAALTYPQVYSKVGVFSPAFWFAKDSLLQYVRRHPANPETRFYFVSGTTESETMVPLMQAVRDSLQRSGVNLAYSTPADGKHAEWFWKREFPAAYRWLYEQDGIYTYKAGARPLEYSAYLNQEQNRLSIYLPTKKGRIEFLDQARRVVLKKKVVTGTNVALGQLAPGNYLLRVSAGKQTGQQLVVKE